MSPSRPAAGERQASAAELLRPAFRRSLWSTYDHIGLLVLANLLWVALSLPIVTAPAATAGLFHLARGLSGNEPPHLSLFFSGFRRHFLPAFKAGVADLAAALVLWVNIDFYSHLGGGVAFPGMLLAAVMIWLSLLYALMHVHIFPMLVAGERSLRQLLRKSLLLTLDNLLFTIGLGAQTLAITALCVVTGAGLVLLGGSLPAVLLTWGRRALLTKYSDASQSAADEPETRTFRDIWRPWENGSTRR